MGRLDGKVMLVTGAARGLGEVVARLGVAQGAHAVLGDVLDDRGAAVAADLGDAAGYVHLDVRVETDWSSAVAGAVARFEHLDVLVNNAAILRLGSIETFLALRGMTKIAAQELGPLNIRVNSVHPGGLRTEMSKGVSGPGVELTPDQVKMRWALNRFPELAEIANVILFLASEEATYTTGAEITCDGGATIGPRYV